LSDRYALAPAIVLIAGDDPARGTHGSVLSGWTLRALFGAALLLAFAQRKRQE